MISAKKVIPLHSSDHAALILHLKNRIERLEKDYDFLPKPTYLIVPSTEGSIFIDPQEIISCSAASSSCLIHLNQQKICVSRTLKWVNNQLISGHFIRIHNSHLINARKVTRYKKSGKAMIELKNGICLPVSRSHRADLENYFNI